MIHINFIFTVKDKSHLVFHFKSHFRQYKTRVSQFSPINLQTEEMLRFTMLITEFDNREVFTGLVFALFNFHTVQIPIFCLVDLYHLTRGGMLTHSLIVNYRDLPGFVHEQ